MPSAPSPRGNSFTYGFTPDDGTTLGGARVSSGSFDSRERLHSSEQ